MAISNSELEKTVGAILVRDAGLPYAKILEYFEMTPDQFYRRVVVYPENVLLYATESKRIKLERILEDQDRVTELFNMGEDFVSNQYDKIQEGIRPRFFPGTFRHPENIKTLVYHALTKNNPILGSNKRDEVVEGFEEFFIRIEGKLEEYFYSIGLGGLMVHGLNGTVINSAFSVLDTFDLTYQQKTGDKFSLFDLRQKKHLHKWGYVRAPRDYWKDEENVVMVIYHTLVENHPELKSRSRRKVISTIRAFPANISSYLHKLGLGGLIQELSTFNKNESGISVLQIFDMERQKIIGDASLFDSKQKYHLSLDGKNNLVRT